MIITPGRVGDGFGVAGCLVLGVGLEAAGLVDMLISRFDGVQTEHATEEIKHPALLSVYLSELTVATNGGSR